MLVTDYKWAMKSPTEVNKLILSLLGDTKFSNFWFYVQNPKVWLFNGKQYFIVVLFLFQFCTEFVILEIFFINFGLGTVRN